MKVVSVLGTRPELIKMSEIIKKLDNRTEHVLVHTGQNHAPELRDVFFDELDLGKPTYSLDVAGETLGVTLANIMAQVEEVLDKEKPDAVVILGDTNSGLAGILAKRKKIPFFHLEAGNRCFDDNVPEEINRRLLDHIADVNMVYTQNQRLYLMSEGIAKDRIFVMGSPMREVIEHNLPKINKSDVVGRLGLKDGKYFLASIHRDENTTIPKNFNELIESLNLIAFKYGLPIVLSAHPRTEPLLKSATLHKLIQLHKPFGFIDYMKLQAKSACVLSDSGTIAEESSIIGFPAITIRNTFERIEAVDAGTITLTGADRKSILSCVEAALTGFHVYPAPPDYLVPNCSERVLKAVLGYTSYVNRYVWQK